MGASFIMPNKIISGEKALEDAIPVLGAMGKKPLIVTDEVMVKLGNCAHVEDALKSLQMSYAIYDGISGEPTDEMIQNGLEQYKKEGCDFLIALGGGSPIDSAKAIGAMVTNAGNIDDYMGKIISNPLPPLAAIPTTAGTGSEATCFTIITNTKDNIKMLLKGDVLMPKLAIVDPQFTITAPPAITAATGLDALTHAIESFTSRKSQPLTETFAISAVKRIFTYLPKAYEDGSDVKARVRMSVAALEAGIAFSNSSVTLVHGMSRPIGALFHVPHGLSNAMLLKECLGFALDGAYDRFARLGRAIGVAHRTDSAKEAAEAFLDAVVDLCDFCQVPTLGQFGVRQDVFQENIDKMAEDAIASGSPANTIKEVTVEDVKRMYGNLWH